MTLHSTRRDFLSASVAAAGTVALAPRWAGAEEAAVAKVPRGKAEHCIFMWLGGGAGQIDTWDPKPQGDPKAKKPGSYYSAIDTAIPGVQVCEHLPESARLLERMVLVRSVHHEVIDEHAAAVNRMHTGRPTSGSVVYPSVGSIVSHERGPAGEGVPAYVLIGYPNVTRGPGFLGAKHGYIYLTDTESGPAGLSRALEITTDRQARRERLLAKVRAGYLTRESDDALVQQYDATVAEALRLSGPEFKRIFELDQEPGSLRDAYGGEFGQRCLLSRRLVEAGVRFIEVSHNLNFLNGTGWDVHNDGIQKQHALIRELDTALATLVRDLEEKRLLEKTLIVVATEFGRPAAFDGGGGRGHHSKSFSVVLAGGGLTTGQVIGQTDDLAMTIASRPVSVPDLHATIHAALGINPRGHLYAAERPVPITDGGTPLSELF